MSKLAKTIYKQLDRFSTECLFLNTDAQIAGILVFAVGLCVIAFYIIILSPMMANMADLQNSLQAMGWPTSQRKIDSLNQLSLAWSAVPVLAVLLLILWLVMNALRENSGDV